MRLAQSTILALIASTPLLAAAGEIVAMVDLQFIQDTGKAASFTCMHAEGEDCSGLANFYLWRARVVELVSGEEQQNSFLVLYGAPDLPKADLRAQRLVMRRLETNSPAEPRYHVIGIAAKEVE